MANKKKKKNMRSQKQNSDLTKQKAKLKELDEKKRIYKAALSKLALSDISKKPIKSYTKFTKERYRGYIENPMSNEANIREMSNFLYRASMPYRRFINYLSDIPRFYWVLEPQIDFSSSTIPEDKIMKNYYKMLQTVQNMSIASEMRKVLQTTIREGIFYGFVYEDKNSFFIHKLDPTYCRIVEMEGNCYNFAFDFSFFSKYPTYLEYMDPSFKTLHSLYEKDTTNNRWQLLDPTKTICIKSDTDIVDEVLPMLIGIFEALIDLIDARALQRNKEEIQNYKLIVQKIPFFEDTKDIDDFSLSIEMAKSFFQRLSDVVPESVGVALSPMDIDTVNFEDDDKSNDLISSSMRAVFNDSGISQLLFNTEKTGSVGLDASAKVDAAMVWKIVESIENWIRRYIAYKSTGSSRYFFEILHVDIFNENAVCERELKLANSGVPNKLKLAASDGINPYRALSSNYFENQMLKLHDSWVPLQTSYTMPGETTSDTEAEVKKDETARNNDLEGNKEGIE